MFLFFQMSVEVLEAAHKCDVIMSTELQVQLINYEDSNKKYVSSEIDTNLYNTMVNIFIKNLPVIS